MEVSSHKLHKRGTVTEKTLKKYKDQAIKFSMWCKERFGCRHPEECLEHIQDYSDWLAGQGKSANTIHTYLAGVCRWYGIPMKKIKKPQRVLAENTRGRGQQAVDQRADAQREASPRLWDFAAAVGIRRREYRRLCGDDLVLDESGYLCVRVKRGKGGKYQEQRILPEDVDFVRSFFNGGEAQVFAEEELKNKIDLHHLRALQAQRAYRYYLDRLEAEPGYREQLTAELKARWARRCRKKWSPQEMEGYYYLRDANRRLAKANGLSVKYDRLAVMAVSILHLSHWRLDVTIGNYLLAL